MLQTRAILSGFFNLHETSMAMVATNDDAYKCEFHMIRLEKDNFNHMKTRIQ
jgi:hypothetical protein